MDKISDLALKSQTVCGALHFFLFVISWPTIIDSLKGLLDKDRLNFNCDPKPSDASRQQCYKGYISTVSPLFIPLNFASITFAILGFFWIAFILYSVVELRGIKNEQSHQRKECLSKRFTWGFLIHVCIQLAVLGVLMGVFCGFQSLHLPEEYICSQGNTTQIPTNQQVNLTCNDLHQRQKSRLNIGIVTTMGLSIFLCIVSIIHLLLTRKDFLKQLLGDQESDSPDARPLGELRSDKNVHVFVYEITQRFFKETICF